MTVFPRFLAYGRRVIEFLAQALCRFRESKKQKAIKATRILEIDASCLDEDFHAAATVPISKESTKLGNYLDKDTSKVRHEGKALQSWTPKEKLLILSEYCRIR